MPYSSHAIRPHEWSQLRYFKPAEFDHPHLMGYEFLLWLDRLRNYAGEPLIVSSDHRTELQNVAAGGAADSAHEDIPTDCVDVVPARTMNDPNGNRARYRIVAAAITLGCQRIGFYPDGSLHLDRTEGRRPAPRFWNIRAPAPPDKAKGPPLSVAGPS